jgi:hypothetical protein
MGAVIRLVRAPFHLRGPPEKGAAPYEVSLANIWVLTETTLEKTATDNRRACNLACMAIDYDLEKALLADVFLDLSDYEIKKEPLPPHRRRSVIRAIFAAVEGQLWVMKQKFLDFAGPTLTPAEVAMLREVQYGFGGDGGAVEKPARITLKENIRFAIAMMGRLHPGTAVDLGGSGWVALTNSLKVRDRLMHPKDSANIEVSEDEITTALDGLLWFMKLTDAGSRAVAEFVSTPRGKQLLMARALRDKPPTS